MELLEIMQRRRSVRTYTGEPIPAEKIEQVLQAGLFSASGRSRRPWEFIVVRDRATLDKMALFRSGLHRRFFCGFCLFFLVEPVLSCESAIPAERNKPHGKELSRPLASALKKRRPKADGEFVDFEFENFACEIVSELVNGDHHEQNENRKQDPERRFQPRSNE